MAHLCALSSQQQEEPERICEATFLLSPRSSISIDARACRLLPVSSSQNNSDATRRRHMAARGRNAGTRAETTHRSQARALGIVPSGRQQLDLSLPTCMATIKARRVWFTRTRKTNRQTCLTCSGLVEPDQLSGRNEARKHAHR